MKTSDDSELDATLDAELAALMTTRPNRATRRRQQKSRTLFGRYLKGGERVVWRPTQRPAHRRVADRRRRNKAARRSRKANR